MSQGINHYTLANCVILDILEEDTRKYWTRCDNIGRVEDESNIVTSSPIPSFQLNNQTLSVVDDYVYLGVTFNYNNKFRKAQKKQLNQARRAMYSLLSKSYSLDLPIDILLELFDQLVIPVLLYGSEVWGFEVIRNLEVFHMKFCKQIFKLNRSTANCMVLGELGRFSLEKYISNRMINFWCNLEHSGQNKLSGMVYNVLKLLYNENVYQSPWIKIK